ncbi:M48 family metallopeptidase [Fibrobacter sp. UWP2]|uniref:M48 family metallopeptidase n=1 Tax=Fibrobacter sp. UWP2 TaxID=1896216 RepID=UPI00092386D6|nr:M48 family metallopeptidase [Fibrobacter sp. UWP2]SHJ41845.1 heat shock protein HtpX [Fibrobacter sp. UWP2]
MKYVGIQTQIDRNNRNTVLLLLMFPVIILGMVFFVICFLEYFGFFSGNVGYGNMHWDIVFDVFKRAFPYTVGIVGTWFIIAYFANTAIIRHATHARPLERKENVRVYNIVENLCIAGDIEMPKINIVKDGCLNAFASGIDINSFTITLTTGIIDELNDEELSAVVGHELAHIKNRDTRLMVVCIVFVGIFASIQSAILHTIGDIFDSATAPRYHRRRGGGLAFLILVLIFALIVVSIGYLFSTLTRLAISRSREYVADAGGAELCANPTALASALRKISAMPGLGYVSRGDVAQLYIIHPAEEGDEDEVRSDLYSGLVAKINSIFLTHPDTPERIRLLEQF